MNLFTIVYKNYYKANFGLLYKYMGALLVLLFIGPCCFAQRYDCEEEMFLRQDKKSRLFGYGNFMGEWKIPPTFIKAYPFTGKNAVVMIGKQMGVIDCEGHTVLLAIYDAIGVFQYGKGWVKKGDFWGFVNLKGQTLMPFQYTDVRELSLTSPVTWVQKDNKWGLYDKDLNRRILEPVFDSYAQASDSAAIVRRENRFSLILVHYGQIIVDSTDAIVKLNNLRLKYLKNGQWGLAGMRGSLLMKPQYDSIGLNNTTIIIGKKGKLGIASQSGKVYAEPYLDSVGNFAEGKAPALKNTKYGFISSMGKELGNFEFQAAGTVFHSLSVVKKDGKFGLFNLQTLKFAIPPKYQNLLRIPGTDYLFAKLEGKYKPIDQTGNELQAEAADTLVLTDSLDFIRYSAKGQTRFYNARSNSFSIPDAFLQAGPFSNGIACVRKAEGWGVINQQGLSIINCEWDSVGPEKWGTKPVFKVKRKGLYGFAGLGNTPIIPVSYRQAWFAGPDYVKVKKDERWGIYSLKENKDEHFDFEWISHKGNNPTWPEWPTIVMRKGKYGLSDSKGEYVYKPSADSVRYAGQGIFVFFKEGKAALVNMNGKQITDFQYDDITTFSDNMAGFKQGGKWGFLNGSGRVITAPRFEAVTGFIGRAAYVKENGKWGAWEKSGQYLLKPEYDGWKTIPGGGRHLFKK